MARYYRRVIRITGDDSPNVKFARWQQSQGVEPTNDIILEGVLTWDEYQTRLKTWDEIRLCSGIHAIFYVGPGLLLFPPAWLIRANKIWRNLRGQLGPAASMGIDTAEGGDSTSYAIGNSKGLIELVSFKTPNTDIICGHAIALGAKHGVKAQNWYFDRGGGGKQHADRLRGLGYPANTIPFGGVPTLELKRGLHLLKDRKEVEEERYGYVDRRSEMYGELSILLDPYEHSLTRAVTDERYEGVEGSEGFAIPGPECGPVYEELRRQMIPIPKQYLNGKLFLPPKHKRDAKDTRITLDQLVGHSPDELDSVVLMVAGLSQKGTRTKAGAAS